MLRFKTKMRTAPQAVYVEPATGYRVPWETSFDEVLDKVRKHKEAHGIELTEGWQDEVEHQIAMTLKVSNWDEWCYDTENPYVPRLVAYGRQMWKELHEYAQAYPEIPDEHTKANALSWYRGWEARIPSAKCNCAANWAKMGEFPDLRSRADFVRWSVRAHDKVNALLGKPMFQMG